MSTATAPILSPVNHNHHYNRRSTPSSRHASAINDIINNNFQQRQSSSSSPTTTRRTTMITGHSISSYVPSWPAQSEQHVVRVMNSSSSPSVRRSLTRNKSPRRRRSSMLGAICATVASFCCCRCCCRPSGCHHHPRKWLVGLLFLSFPLLLLGPILTVVMEKQQFQNLYLNKNNKGNTNNKNNTMIPPSSPLILSTSSSASTSFHFLRKSSSSGGGAVEPRSSSNHNSNNINLGLQQRPPQEVYDVAIVGAGPAGLTAALFAGRAGLSTILLGSKMGLLAETPQLDNFPGYYYDDSFREQRQGGSGGGFGGGGGGDDAVDVNRWGSGTHWLVATRLQIRALPNVHFAPSGLLVQQLHPIVQSQQHSFNAAQPMKHASPNTFHWPWSSSLLPSSSSLFASSWLSPFFFRTPTPPTTTRLFQLELAAHRGSYTARSVIVATGATPRRLHLPNEDNVLWGRSIHSCAICDGSNYVNQTVVVVGGGHAAIDAALYLSRWASRVVLVHRRNEFQLPPQSQSLQLIHETANIEVHTPYTVQEWIVQEQAIESDEEEDDDNLEQPAKRNQIPVLVGVRLQKAMYDDPDKKKDESIVNCQGAFLMIGATPNTQWLNQTLDLDTATALIRLHNHPNDNGGGDDEERTTTQTSLPGVFAAGEVTDSVYKQAITAASAGAQAALDAERWLRRQPSLSTAEPLLPSLASTTTTTSSQSAPSKLTPQDPLALHPLVGEQQEKRIRTGRSSHWKRIGGAGDASGGATTRSVVEPFDPNDNCDLTNEDCILSIVHKYPLVVFSKPGCPFCTKAMEALSLAGVAHPHVIDLSKYRKTTYDIQSTLQRMTGRRTVPNVFVGGESIGGGDETAQLQWRGELRPLLEKAGAVQSAVTPSKARLSIANAAGFTKSVPALSFDDDTEEQRNDENVWDKESCDLGESECMTSIIHKYPLVVFSSHTCLECRKLLELLRTMARVQEPRVVELGPHNQIDSSIRQQLYLHASSRSVPSLFVGGESIGGYNAASRLFHTGQLIPKLEEAGVQLME